MSEVLRILILEDQPADAELVEHELRKAGFEFVAKCVSTEHAFLAELRDSAPELILADYSLPGYDGLSALAAAQKICPGTPFIFVSGSMGEEKAIETLHRGATDYVLKQRLARLEPAVRRALREQEETRKREQAEKARQEAEARYRALFEHSPDGIVILDPETARPLEFNSAAHRQLGYSREEFARLSLADIEAKETLEQSRAAIDEVRLAGRKDFETWQRTREGQIRHVHVTAQTVETSGRSVYHCIWRDITDRKLAEQHVHELNLMVKASGAIHALMVRERDPQRLLAEACKILVETRGYQFAWIGLVEPGSKRVVPAAHAGKDGGYLDSLRITFDETPTGQGPTGTAIRTGQAVCCENTVTDPKFAPWREAAMARGFASTAAMPMVHGSRVLGAVSVYAVRPEAFNAEELALLKELADDLAFALQSIEDEQERRWAEESLGESERRYRLLFNGGYDAVFVHQEGSEGNGSGKFIEVNEIACQRLGYTRGELLQMTPRDISAPETLRDIPGIEAKLALEKSAVSEGVHITKDGRRIPVEISIHVFELNGKPTRLSAVRDITERKRAEAHSHLLGEALESTANAIVITDREGAITWANAAFTKLTGYPLEEALGRKPSFLKSGTQEQTFYAKLWETVLAGRVWSAEMINRRKDGSLYTEENTITPVRNEHGEITHFIAVKQDITERKQAEAALRQKEEYFRALTEQATDVTTLLSAEGTIQYESPSTEQVFGYKPGELVGRSCFDLIHPEDVARVQGALAEMVATPGAAARIEVRFQRKDSSWCVLESTARSLLDDPNVKGIVVNSRDITERKQLEDALRESSQFSRQIIASAQEGIVVYGRDLKYQVWNPFMEQLTGLPADQVLGKHPDELFPFLREAGLQAVIEKTLADAPTFSIEVHVEGQPTGISGWTSQTNGPLRNAAGEIIGVIGIVRDITERKRAELRIAAFANLGQRLSAATTARQAAEIIVAVADELLGWDACLFDLYSAADNRLSHLLSMDLIDGRRAECKPAYPHGPPTELGKRAIEEGGQLILRAHPDAVRTETVTFGNTSRPSASILFVPIRHRLEVIGVLSIQSYTAGAYDAYGLETLQALADHAGGALERLRAQEALSESEATFRSVWEHSIDGMRLTDKKGSIIAVNEAFCRLVKLPREKLERQIFSVAYKGHGATDGIELYHKRFASGDIVPRLTTRTQLWNAEEVDLEISASFVELGQHGKMLLSIFRDVSERKRAELRISAFANLGQRLNTADTARGAGEIIVEAADELLGWDACLFDLYSAAENKMTHLLSMDLIDGRRTECKRRDLDPSPREIPSRAIKQGAQLILRNDPKAIRPEGMPFGDISRPSASLMFVPLRHGTEVVGVLSIQSYTPNAYTQQDLQTLQALADHCGGALNRLRMEAALHASEVRYRRLFESAKDGILILDAETGRVVDVNPFLVELLGFSRAAFLGKKVWELGFFKDLVANEANFAELQRKGYVRYEDMALETREGGRIEVEFVSNVYLVNLQKVIQCNIRDISVRKRAEAELKRSHEQYRRAIAAANAIPYQKMYGTETYEFMGEGIKDLTGYAPDELCSKVWGEIILETVFMGEAAGLPFAEAARRTLAGEIKLWRADHRIRTRSGAIRWISDSSVQLLDADGKFSGSLGIIQDITERKALEEQLRQSQKMDAVGQLAGGVAHDFNNMLAVIRGNAELLLMDAAQYTAETRVGLTHVMEASDRAANLTRQLLAFSRKQVLQPQPLVLNEIIANLTKMLKRVIGENIDLRCDYAEPLPCVQADTGMMEQVILNLVVNARDAMPAGGKLHVATEQVTLDDARARINPEARAGEFVCLKVSDTGMGIAPEILSRIFEPFFTTKEVGKGTGLGLATIYGIVQQHQGWIEVSSEIGKGSTFKVFLPATPTPAQPAEPSEAGAAIQGGKETILLVEDERAVRLTTRRVLESKGYKIREATSGREALEVWHRHEKEISLLLTDIVMPEEMTGRGLAEQLWKQRPGLKVIFMSGYSAEVLGKGTDFIRRTRSQFLQKPCTSRMLLETVRRCLDG